MERPVAIELELPRTAEAAALGDRRLIRENLESELANHIFSLVDERWCQEGGWPEDEEFWVSGFELQNGAVIATILVSLSEMTPSACRDSPYSTSRQGSMRLSLPAGSTVATITDEDGGGDLSDRNSDADGC